MSSFSCMLSSLYFLLNLQFSDLSRSIPFLFNSFSHLRNKWYRNIIFFLIIILDLFLLLSFLSVSDLRLFFHILSFFFFTVWTISTFAITFKLLESTLVADSVPILCSLIGDLRYCNLLGVFKLGLVVLIFEVQDFIFFYWIFHFKWKFTVLRYLFHFLWNHFFICFWCKLNIGFW
jgi:hypothetical protein